MKRAKVFGSIKHFEDFINSPDVSVIDIKVQTVEQSYNFQDCFVGVVFYEDAPQNAKELAATTANSQSIKLRQIIIELGKRGVIGASKRDTAIVDEICKREGIIL